MGPSAETHGLGITVLGAVNTVAAGVLSLIKGKGLPEKLRRDKVELRRLQDWIKETEALMVLGVAGQAREEVGELVATAFEKWNGASELGEDTRPVYVRGEHNRKGASPERGSRVRSSAVSAS